MKQYRLALIVDERSIAVFQLEALRQLNIGSLDVFSCRNTQVHRRPVKHFLYYLMKLLLWRSSHERKVALSSTALPPGRTVEFDSIYDKAWQSLPADVVKQLRSGSYDAILKFGMNLMRVPPELEGRILSYHHGDPDRYRGRPAGFYELLHGECVMGQIVQILSNRLDAGHVVAFAETKVRTHSYARTLAESFRHSPLLLPVALRNLAAGKVISKESGGKNFRMPSNLSVLKLICRTFSAGIKRIAYGALVEKQWKVSLAALPGGDVDGILRSDTFPPPQEWRNVEANRDYTFYADPFFLGGDPDRLLLEAMDRRTGKGRLLLVDPNGEQTVLSRPGKHFSYPGTVEESGLTLVLPETASWAPPTLFQIEDGELREFERLSIEGEPRLLDPTLLAHDGRYYLFGNEAGLGDGVLSLWSADSLHSLFARHPDSPIRISPRGSRMAGSLLTLDGRLLRLGQDSSRTYGDGIFIFSVNELSPRRYEEELVGRLAFSHASGPHTLNIASKLMVFDWYRDRFSLLAGVRRALGKLT